MLGKRNKKNNLGEGEAPFSKVLPYWDIYKDIMVLKDGRLMYGFYFEPPTHIHFTPDNLKRRSVRLKAVFDLAIPDGETMSTYTSLRGAHEEAVQDTRKYAENCPDPVLSELTRTRAELLEMRGFRALPRRSLLDPVTETPREVWLRRGLVLVAVVQFGMLAL